MPNDVDVYVVLDDFGARGRSWREIDEDRTDRETVIRDRLEGQYSDPVGVVAFNTAERWSRDVSEKIACELGRRLAPEGRRGAGAAGGISRSTRSTPAGAAAIAAARRGLTDAVLRPMRQLPLGLRKPS